MKSKKSESPPKAQVKAAKTAIPRQTPKTKATKKGPAALNAAAVVLTAKGALAAAVSGKKSPLTELGKSPTLQKTEKVGKAKAAPATKVSAKAASQKVETVDKAKAAPAKVSAKAAPVSKKEQVLASRKVEAVEKAKAVPAAKVSPKAAPVVKQEQVPAPRKVEAVEKAKAVPPVKVSEKAVPVVKQEQAPTPRKVEAVEKAKAVPAAKVSPKAVPVPKRGETPALQKMELAGTVKAVSAPVVKPQKAVKPPERKIPAILLEGDNAAPPLTGGPGRRYVLGPVPPLTPPASAGPELPESYGTQQLFLTARDPRWLYAHWDFTGDQLRKYNVLSADGHLLLRLYQNVPDGQPLLQIHLHPESRHWFVPAPYAETKYTATLGYYDAAKNWIELTRSGATLTPPDSLAADISVRFATIPLDIPFEQLLASVQTAVRENPPLAEAVQELRAEGFSRLPEPEEIAGPWTPAQEKALAAVVMLDQARRVWIGSVEVTELIRRQLEQEVASIGAAQFGQGISEAGQASGAGASPAAAFGSVTSPSGGKERRRGFWFNVNAELIVYGSTEADATVTIGGRTIPLRRDGSFSFRFALPDGHYELPVAAQSADQEETRRADLNFSRASEYQGGVEAHPQNPKLQPPLVSAVA